MGRASRRSSESGLAASGLVYVAMGVVSARVAFLGARNRDEGVPGALRFLLEQPYGSHLLGAVVVGLCSASRSSSAVEAVTGRRRSLLARVGLAVNAIGYAALAWTSARLLLHVGREGGSLERDGIAWLLNAPGGGDGARARRRRGDRRRPSGRSFQGLRGPAKAARRPPGRSHADWRVVARFGLVARGVVLGALGYFLFRAAEESDPRSRAVGRRRPARHSRTRRWGPWFVGVVALGLAAYGVHLWTLALWKRRV